MTGLEGRSNRWAAFAVCDRGPALEHPESPVGHSLWSQQLQGRRDLDGFAARLGTQRSTAHHQGRGSPEPD